MADISEWSTKEEENTHLDELTLSGEGGQYINKIMCAVKDKMDDVDGKLAKVQGAYVFRGTVADMTALEAVDEPDNGDVYSVTALGGENYAWNGAAWDDLGTSDANVVHKTGNETIAGEKTFSSDVTVTNSTSGSRTKYITSDMEVWFGIGNTGATGIYDQTHGKYMLSRNVSTGNMTVRSYSNEGTTEKSLVLGTDGSATWNGQTIQTTSDERLKTPLAVVPDEILDAWGNINWGQFKFLEAVESKGETARLHLGLIAQRVKRAFEDRGLDACDYGILCHEMREATEDDPGTELWMVRYTEALAMEAAYQRRRAARLEARLEALEDRINGN